MKVQKSHLRIALFILGAAVLFSVFNYLRPAPRTGGRQAPEAPLLETLAATGGQIDPLSIRAPHDVDMARVPEYARDPFLFGDETRNIVRAALAGASDARPAPSVRSILFSSTRRLAVVDGKIVGVGDQVGAYKVAEIEQGAVVFSLATGERRRESVHGAVPAGLIR
jgi:hypothetical protein